MSCATPKIEFKNAVRLTQPPLLDLSTFRPKDEVKIVIFMTQHKFATDAAPSGMESKKQPIFGSRVLVNGKLFSEQDYGLPFLRLRRGTKPKITYENTTLYTFNIHYHGLNTTGSVDGTAMEVVFGKSTLLGPKVTFQFPEVTNNQCLLWFHGHNMFVSMELICAGIVGLLQITDKQTDWLTERFQYGDNQLLLAALDMDLTKNGKQTFANLVADENRSNFTVVNGTSVVSWYDPKATRQKGKNSEQKKGSAAKPEEKRGKLVEGDVPFVNPVFHVVSKNLVKIDILNASLNWRVFYLGVCDEDAQVKHFHLIQTDSGLTNPSKLQMIVVPVAGRIGILIDLNEFKHQTAYLFFYNCDLTEIVDSTLTAPSQPNDPSITGTIPDLKDPDPTPYPTPIPDPDQKNQQGDPSNLDYPTVTLIPQVEEVLQNGSIPKPKHLKFKPFLRINLDKCCSCLSLEETLDQVRRTVFGSSFGNKCPALYPPLLGAADKVITREPNFEYDPKFNYLPFLNPAYFYNLPSFEPTLPTRNLFLFSEANTNAQAGGNPYGTTEYVDGANRIMVDLWNSAELDLDWALKQYAASPNNYKPPTLPTSKFRIRRTDDRYSNTAMISNDTLVVQLYTQPVTYGDFKQKPVASVTIVFPAVRTLNLQEWINLVNKTFQETALLLPSGALVLSQVLECDWSFFPYTLNFMYEKTVYIKSAVIKTKNASPYWVRLLGRWPLLQFFGKSLTGNTLDAPDMLTQLQTKQQQRSARIWSAGRRAKEEQRQQTKGDQQMKPAQVEMKKNLALYSKCDEVGIYGIYDAEIQQIFPFYATNDGEVQLPIACMKRNAELIIAPTSTFVGLYDGYLNDNLNSFSVTLRSSEIWIYTNGDSTDAHPCHFHLTSAYATPQSSYNSPGLISRQRRYDPLLYSRDIYQVGPQEQVSFHLTWPYYSSEEATRSPPFKGIGGVVHCHFLQHNDANSMIISYYVDPPAKDTILQQAGLQQAPSSSSSSISSSGRQSSSSASSIPSASPPWDTPPEESPSTEPASQGVPPGRDASKPPLKSCLKKPVPPEESETSAWVWVCLFILFAVCLNQLF